MFNNLVGLLWLFNLLTYLPMAVCIKGTICSIHSYCFYLNCCNIDYLFLYIWLIYYLDYMLI